MGYMFEGMDPVASTKQKLKNALKGSAMMTREATYLSPKQKLWELDTIGEFLKYIEDYEPDVVIVMYDGELNVDE